MSRGSRRLSHRNKCEATSAIPYGVDVCLEAGALPSLWGFRAGPGERFRHSAGCLSSVITSVYECLVIGVGLGILGAAVVACAIPILMCIPPLSQ